ncbi:MAG: HAD family hydrolase [Methanomicrobia archaeon]|nr:HAD family hydrolase [Methanomicrobia archaeon]
MIRSELEAVLFDLDGVLIDSFESWYQAFSSMLRAYNKPEMSRETFRARCWGPDLRHNLSTLQLGEDAAWFCVREQQQLIGLVELMPHAEVVLRRTQEEYRLKVGLVTNTPRANVKKILEHFHLTGHFDAVLTGDDVERGKPDAEIVLKACEQLAVRPEHAILVGDTRTDFQAGRAASCLVIGVGLGSAGDLHIERLEELFTLEPFASFLTNYVSSRRERKSYAEKRA